MKKKKILSTVLAGVMVVSATSLITGCSENAELKTSNSVSSSNISDDSNSASSSDTSDNSNSDKKEKSSDKTIDFSMLDWKIQEDLVDGKRYPIFSYTNNSEYTICDFVLVFRQKATTTIDDLEVFSEAIEELEISGDELDELSFTAECTLFTRPGETNGNDTIAIDNRIGYRVTNMKQYDLIEPDYAKIAFIDNGYIYEMTYDFINKKSIPGEKAVAAYNWTESELGKAIPKIECEVTSVRLDYNDYFSVAGFDISEDMKNTYINALLNMGYETDDELTRNYLNFYKDNYDVDVSYSEKSKELYVSVETKDESEME